MWSERYTIENKPDFQTISDYVNSEQWDRLCEFIDKTYAISPSVEYSKCSGAPGWNVKYKKSSRALCTLYPNENYFTCLVCMGRKEAPEAELILNNCTQYIQELYNKTEVFNGTRWLMIDVKSAEILEDVLELLCIRMHPPKQRKN